MKCKFCTKGCCLRKFCTKVCTKECIVFGFVIFTGIGGYLITCYFDIPILKKIFHDYYSLISGGLFLAFLINWLLLDVPIVIRRAFKNEYISFDRITQMTSKEFSLYEDTVLKGLLIALYKDDIFKDNLWEMGTDSWESIEIPEFDAKLKILKYKDKNGGCLKIDRKRADQDSVISLLISLAKQGARPDIFQIFFPKIKNNEEISLERLKKDSVEFSYFKRLSMQDYRDMEYYTFIKKLKEFETTGEIYKKWLKNFLDGNLNN